VISYIGERKWSYFHPPEKFRYCSGSKSACQDLQTEGYTFIPWNAQAQNLPIKNIKLLHLEPTKEQLKKAVLPSFMFELSRLEHAVFELNFLKNLETKPLPSSLRSLVLSRNLAYSDLLEQLIADQVSWSHHSFRKLEALLIIADEEKDKLFEDISPTILPNLRFLEFSLSKKSQLSVFKQFSNLTDLEITGLQDYPIFEYITHLPLVSLNLGGSSKKFSVQGLASLKSLEFIRLNGVRAEIDCQLFTALPNLKEVVILNSKNIRNVEALLHCPNLKSADFLDCNNPFKGVARKFHERGFEHLDIAYA
jgi:hypothetical protein